MSAATPGGDLQTACGLMTWEQWWRLATLTDEEYAARSRPCPRCDARRNEPCLSATGLAASRPCPARLTGALAELPAAELVA